MARARKSTSSPTSPGRMRSIREHRRLMRTGTDAQRESRRTQERRSTIEHKKVADRFNRKEKPPKPAKKAPATKRGGRYMD